MQAVAGTTETYAYDGDGVRFSRQVGASPLTRYVTDPTAGLPVTIADGTRTYVWGLGLAYAVSGSNVEVYHADRLGSTRVLTNSAGSVIASYRSDEFGIPVASSGSSSQPFRFTGEPLDDTGLTYLRARYYDAGVGRFTTVDPFSGVRQAPSIQNRYAYSWNRPTSVADHSGRNPCLGAALTGAAVGGTGGTVMPVAGNAAGAAGGAVVGFVVCAAAVLVGVGIVGQAIDQRDNDAIPVIHPPVWEPRPAPAPPEFPPPGDDPFGKKTPIAIVLVLVTTTVGSLFFGMDENGEPIRWPPADRSPKPRVLQPSPTALPQ